MGKGVNIMTLAENHRPIRIIREPQTQKAEHYSGVHSIDQHAEAIPLHQYLLGKASFSFDYNQRPAVITVEERGSDYFKFGLQVTTRYVDWEGVEQVANHWCISKTLEGAVDTIPDNIRLAIENKRSTLDNA